MRRPVLIVGAVLWTLAFAVGAWMFASMQAARAEAQAQRFKLQQQVEAGPREELVPPDDWQPPRVEGFTLIDQTGEEVTAETLAGQPYVAGFIFTRCQSHCPDLLGKMVELRQALGDYEGRFLTVTVDPEHDTPEVMADFADIYSEDADQWKFLTGEPEELLQLVRFGHRVLPPGEPTIEDDLGPAAAHSLRLMHVGADGRLIGSYFYADPTDITRLRRVLRGKAETAEENLVRPPLSLWVKPNGDRPDDPENEAGETPGDTTEAGASTSDAGGPDGELQAATRDSADVEARTTGDGNTRAAVTGAAIDPASVDASPRELDEAVDDSRTRLAKLPEWARPLPTINASLNALATVLLIGGYLSIRGNNAHRHRAFMLATVGVSAAFLASYLTYHVVLTSTTGLRGRPFEGTGVIRPVYFTLLISHIVLAVVVLVPILLALKYAYQRRWQAHKRLVRWVFPVWLYVSVTGVVIYGMLYHWPTA